MPPAKSAAQKLLDEAGRFVAEHEGCWEHSDWEGFLGKVEKLGFETDDELKRNIGNILEATKALYFRAPAAPAKKTAKKAAKKTTKKAAK